MLLVHKNCGGNIVLDLSESYKIVSASLKITPKIIEPGVIEIFNNGKKSIIKFTCKDCMKIVDGNKENLNSDIQCQCSICQELSSPSNVFIHDGGFFFCQSCIRIVRGDKTHGELPIYDYIRGMDLSQLNVTVLTVLMKHSK